MAEEEASTKVSGIYLYPIKSCRGIATSSAYLTPTGLQWDRQWVIVNASGRFITQRQCPKLALIQVSLPVEALDHNWRPIGPDSTLCLKAPGMEPLHVSLSPTGVQEKVEVTVWEWSGRAFDEGRNASDWLSKFIGRPGLRLVRFDTDRETRHVDPKYAKGFKTTFSDGYPILLISEASLDSLNEHLPQPLPMNRFRPNIRVTGCGPFAEDLWQHFKIGDLSFHGVSLCSRCKVTTTNQETGEVGKEPLRTLQAFRLGQSLSTDPTMKGKVYFGQNVVCSHAGEAEAFISIGDEVQVVGRCFSVTELMAGTT